MGDNFVRIAFNLALFSLFGNIFSDPFHELGHMKQIFLATNETQPT